MSQSISHLKNMLWSAEDSAVFAIIHGEALPGIAAKLEEADVPGWDCLWRGEQSPEQSAVAPYVVMLTPESEFSNWLLTDALVTYPDWGLLGVGPVNLLGMREHGRRLLQFERPDGQITDWHWYSPTLWCGLLPQLDAVQLLEAFGPLNDWVVPAVSRWTWLTWAEDGLLVNERQPASGGMA
jgi:Domain of unknown function (DUF4123)